MTTATRTPAQAAGAGGTGRPPAKPRPSTTSSQSGAATEREASSVQGPRDTETRSRARSGRGTADCSWASNRKKGRKPCGRPHPGCGGHNREGLPCGLGRGLGTDHPGIGNCKYHGGSTVQGKKHAARQKVVATLEALAIPAEGDPLEVLQASVEAAHGVLLASRELVKSGASEASLKLYLDGIERAARVAKSAAEAINLDELVRIREREADLLEQALAGTLERFGIGEKRRPQFLAMFREELRARIPTSGELS